ncbi:MAG: hypothetical protein J0H80_04965 [Rhizobiales bacterium]|nr:hypothetical protein [Hyphomicrobiales bacterium]
MGNDDRIAVRARQLFPGPTYPIVISGVPEIPGLRHDGQRWVDETRPDRPFVPVEPLHAPEQWSDLVVSMTPSQKAAWLKRDQPPKKRKSRRRGGF